MSSRYALLTDNPYREGSQLALIIIVIRLDELNQVLDWDQALSQRTILVGQHIHIFHYLAHYRPGHLHALIKIYDQVLQSIVLL